MIGMNDRKFVSDDGTELNRGGLVKQGGIARHSRTAHGPTRVGVDQKVASNVSMST